MWALHPISLSAGALDSLDKSTWLLRVPGIALEAPEIQTKVLFLLRLQETEELRSWGRKRNLFSMSQI